MRIYALALCLAIAAAASSAPSPTSAASSVMLGVNLVVNGNAEAGPGLPTIAPVPGWTTTGHFTAVNYGYDDYPAVNAPGPTARGTRFFSGGTNDSLSSATQTIDVSSLASTVDAGRARYAFSAYIGGFAGQRDYATVSATFLNASNARLSAVMLGPVTNVGRNNMTGVWARGAAGQVPKGTRTIRVKAVSTRFEGASNDGYTDNISLVLSSR